MQDFDPVGGGYLFERLFYGIFSVAEGGFLPAFTATVKFVSLVLIPVFFGFSAWVIIRIWEFRPKFNIRPRPAIVPSEKVARGQWAEIMRRFESGMEADWTLAVVEADGLVDDIFKRIGFLGENLAERMAGISSQEFPEIEDLREAHRVRNNIAHVPGFKLYKSEAERVLGKYEKVLKALEVI
ncbi:MAG TPA: hypothetical protein VJL09_03595 [Candidatus Paceibacterota bacterium]